MGRGRNTTPRAIPVGHQAAGPICQHFRQAAKIVGQRWNPQILAVLLAGSNRFGGIRTAVPGISDRLLSQRLRELEAEGLVERSVHEGPPARVSYCLTAVGRELEPALRELYDWAQRRHENGNGSG